MSISFPLLNAARRSLAILLCGLGPLLWGCSDDVKPKQDSAQVADSSTRDQSFNGDAPSTDLGTPDAKADAAPAAACVIQPFNNLGDDLVPSLQLGEITVTASGQLYLKQNNGMGVDDYQIDGDEWIQLTFATPRLGVSYDLLGGGGTSELFAATKVEGFGTGGESLGIKEVTGTDVKNVTALFEGAALSGFKLQVYGGSSIRMGSVALGCCRYVQPFNDQDQQAATLDLGRLSLTGSAELKLTSGVGLSVVGNDDAHIDQQEWVQFTFASLMFRVSYLVAAVTEEYVFFDYEAFDPAGQPLVSNGSEVQDNDTFTLRAAKYNLISGFKIIADNSGSGHSIESMEFWGSCP